MMRSPGTFAVIGGFIRLQENFMLAGIPFTGYTCDEPVARVADHRSFKSYDYLLVYESECFDLDGLFPEFRQCLSLLFYFHLNYL